MERSRFLSGQVENRISKNDVIWSRSSELDGDGVMEVEPGNIDQLSSSDPSNAPVSSPAMIDSGVVGTSFGSVDSAPGFLTHPTGGFGGSGSGGSFITSIDRVLHRTHAALLRLAALSL
jgi:hypothetical protein